MPKYLQDTAFSKFTNDPVGTFGGVGVVDMQKLLRYVCENGFEHHVAANFSTVGATLYEAATPYFGWSTYRHGS